MIIPFWGEIGIFELILGRLKNAKLGVPIVLATTVNPSDDVLEEIANRHYVKVYRGSMDNVLDRFIKAAEIFGFDKIIRICADNPFLDMDALDYQITEFKNTDVDYWCYSLEDNTPTIKTHYGFWAEGIKLSTLKRIAKMTEEKLFQEHVTNFIYTYQEHFELHFEHIPKWIENEDFLRLTVDTDRDFQTAKLIYSELYSNNTSITVEKILAYIKSNHLLIDEMKNQINSNKK
ncbi:spore coat polysaccharide biosynthesis protein SpsF, cytidylyltransferase family [Bacteroidales bacterium 6E]|nr:spore coat polysaccharide biosynthesis protein SpsF, cytidylyltransferase family [Bacteroidales bacterium 6E]